MFFLEEDSFLCFGKDFLLYCIFVKLPSSLPVQKAYG